MNEDRNTGWTTRDPIMGQQPPMGETIVEEQFIEGTPVYGSDGAKVGTVSEHGVQDNSLVVHHGLMHKDLYVPLSAIERNDASGVYLYVTKDDAVDENWSMIGTTTTMAQTDVGTAARPMGTDRTASDTEEVRVPVMEEELVAGKREEEIGRVHLHKDVTEEQQTMSAPVTREQVRVERGPAQGGATTPGPDAFQTQDIDVPVKGEELVTGKRAVEREEVRLEKQPVTEEEQVTGTVRKERVTVDGADETRG